MSRNKERLGTPEANPEAQDSKTAPVPPSIPTAAMPAPDPIFQIPTEFVELPSRGRYYPTDHPLHGVTEVEIRYMTAKDEDILTNRTLIKKGIAIDRFLQGVLVDQKVRVKDMLVGDKNALVVAARITGYGADYATQIKCPVCQYSFENHFNLDEINGLNGSCDGFEAEYIDGEPAFKVTLPISKATVKARMMTGKDEDRLTQMQTNKRKKGLTETALTDQFLLYLEDVNGETDRNYIARFIQSMPARDSKYLRTAYHRIVPNVNMSHHITCPECDATTEVTMPMTAEFFWPKL